MEDGAHHTWARWGAAKLSGLPLSPVFLMVAGIFKLSTKEKQVKYKI